MTNLKDKTIETAVFLGPVTLNNIKASSITADGSLKYNGLDVTGDTLIRGYVVGIHGHFNKLTINGGYSGKDSVAEHLTILGSADLFHIKIEGPTRIKGGLLAKECTFEDLNIQAEQVFLTDVKADNIQIAKSSEGNNKQLLHLEGATVINGKIEFESGQGEVIMDSLAKVNGKVIGGKIIKNEGSH
jgi:hypothetical protein